MERSRRISIRVGCQSVFGSPTGINGGAVTKGIPVAVCNRRKRVISGLSDGRNGYLRQADFWLKIQTTAAMGVKWTRSSCNINPTIFYQNEKSFLITQMRRMDLRDSPLFLIFNIHDWFQWTNEILLLLLLIKKFFFLVFIKKSLED